MEGGREEGEEQEEDEDEDDGRAEPNRAEESLGECGSARGGDWGWGHDIRTRTKTIMTHSEHEKTETLDNIGTQRTYEEGRNQDAQNTASDSPESKLQRSIISIRRHRHWEAEQPAVVLF